MTFCPLTFPPRTLCACACACTPDGSVTACGAALPVTTAPPLFSLRGQDVGLIRGSSVRADNDCDLCTCVAVTTREGAAGEEGEGEGEGGKREGERGAAESNDDDNDGFFDNSSLSLSFFFNRCEWRTYSSPSWISFSKRSKSSFGRGQPSLVSICLRRSLLCRYEQQSSIELLLANCSNCSCSPLALGLNGLQLALIAFLC